MQFFKKILGIQNNGVIRFLIILLIPYYFLMDSILYVSISQSNYPIITPLQIEKTLNNIFGETTVKKPLTKPVTRLTKVTSKKTTTEMSMQVPHKTISYQT